jgi:para-nitrobenzyl esterase
MESLGVAYAKNLYASDSTDILKEMRSRSWQEVLQAVAPHGTEAGGGTRDHFGIDGYVIAEPPQEVFRKGHQANVPFITGTVADEGILFAHAAGMNLKKLERFLRSLYGEKGQNIMKFLSVKDDRSARLAYAEIIGTIGFVRQSKDHVGMMSAIQPDTYLYQFTRVTEEGKRKGSGCFHSYEIPYLFHVNPTWTVFDEEDWALSKEIAGYWARFARNGNPNSKGSVFWPPYNPKDDRYMIFDIPIRSAQNLSNDVIEFMQNLY